MFHILSKRQVFSCSRSFPSAESLRPSQADIEFSRGLGLEIFVYCIGSRAAQSPPNTRHSTRCRMLSMFRLGPDRVPTDNQFVALGTDTCDRHRFNATRRRKRAVVIQLQCIHQKAQEP